MELKSADLNVLRYQRASSESSESLTSRQIDFVSIAVRRAADDASAAMAHQLSEPLTVLLLYLHDLRQRALVETDPAAFLGTVDMALRATERTCEIIEGIGHNAAAFDIEAALARGSEAIDTWKLNRSTDGDATVAPPADMHPLTARELEVLQLVTDGASNKIGGLSLGISPRTFEAHRANVMRKLRARNVADLIRIALNSSR